MKEELLKMFSDYLEDVDYLTMEQKKLLMQLEIESDKLLSFWKECFVCINISDGRVEKCEKNLSFYVEDTCHLKCGQQEIIFGKEEGRELIARIIDLFEPILPLGSVVELSKEFSDALKINKENEKVKVVIIERFVSTKDQATYFPYVGTVYPVGMLGHGNCINFTSSLIDAVILEG